jgi:superfamily II DNA/RNA helicase
VSSHLKPNLLEALLRKTEHECVLVFTRTKHRAKSLARKLENRGWAATSLQGNLSQNRRQEALEGFRRGSYRIMVATDIAARGIDCEKISHVINFDLPDTAETYTHRIGRTGRAERSGEALTLVTGEDELQVRAIERILGSSIERRKLDGFDYSAAGQRPDPRDEARGPARNAGRNNGRDNGRNASRGGGRGAGRNGAQPRAAREASGQERGTEGRAARSVSDDRIVRDNPYARTLPPLEQPQRAGAARSGTARSRDGEEDQGAGRSRRGRRGGRGKSRNAAQGAPQRRNA